MTQAELKAALVRRTAFVLVANSDFRAHITHREAEQLRKHTGGSLTVTHWGHYAADINVIPGYVLKPTR